jgi:hypothetical protein
MAIDLRPIGNELGVRYAIEGSVQQATLSLRIKARLLDVQNDVHVWGGRFDRNRGDFSRHRAMLVFLFSKEGRWRVERGTEVQCAKSLTPRLNSNRLLGKTSDDNG